MLNRISVRDKHNGDYYALEEFKKSDVKVFNTPEAINNARNKLQTLQMLAELNVNLTSTYICRRYEDLKKVNNYFSYPMIVKNIFGSLGSSTLIVYDFKQLRATFDYLWNINRNDILMVQEFVKSENELACDYRVFILGNKVVASMKREATNDDFRSNYKKGAKVLPIVLTEEEKVLCIKIAQKFNLSIAGIDFIRTKDGPVFLEVNSNPGIEGIRKVTLEQGYDILDNILDYCELLQ